MSNVAATPHVLFVDDDEVMREVWPLLLVPMGFDMLAVEDAQHALEVVRRWLPNVIVTDMMMPGMTGIDLFMHCARTGRSEACRSPRRRRLDEGALRPRSARILLKTPLPAGYRRSIGCVFTISLPRHAMTGR